MLSDTDGNWAEYVPGKRDIPGRMVTTACGEWERRRIPELFNEFFWSSLTLFNRFRSFGFPFAGGWAEQPAHIVDVIEALEGAARQVEAERWQSRKKSG